MKKEIPILFSTPMVQAILDGRKTMTRRLLKKQPQAPRAIYNDDDAIAILGENGPDLLLRFNWKCKRYKKEFVDAGMWGSKCPYGKPGDILWVRESFGRYKSGEIVYKADKTEATIIGNPWKPSIHMPKDAARIWLEVTEVRVEKLHSISDNDIFAEGIQTFVDKGLAGVNKGGDGSARGAFKTLWGSINGNWDSNPWVWVVSFDVLSTTGKP